MALIRVLQLPSRSAFNSAPALYPIIGDRIYGPVGHAVDIFAVIGTVFGVATSLGYGVLQVNAGLNHLFRVPINETVQVILIVVITG